MPTVHVLVKLTCHFRFETGVTDHVNDCVLSGFSLGERTYTCKKKSTKEELSLISWKKSYL